jgi:hypothetical protein
MSLQSDTSGCEKRRATLSNFVERSKLVLIVVDAALEFVHPDMLHRDSNL